AWPEFAEYDCYACHHDLKRSNWRQLKGEADTAPGAFAWGTWYYAVAADATAPAERKALQGALDALATEMQGPSPDRPAVLRQAREAAKLLGRPSESVQQRHDGQAIRGLLRQVAADQRQASLKSWDGAAQVYLSLTALNAARVDLDPSAAPSPLT